MGGDFTPARFVRTPISTIRWLLRQIDDDERGRARRWGITDLDRIYGLEDLAKGDAKALSDEQKKGRAARQGAPGGSYDNFDVSWLVAKGFEVNEGSSTGYMMSHIHYGWSKIS